MNINRKGYVKYTTMNDQQRLLLQDMIKTNQTEDMTELIRTLKHSSIIRDEAVKLIAVREKYNGQDNLTHQQGALECPFLFAYYTDLFNKIRKDEISVELLWKFLDVLKQIEEGELDQHEGSFRVGTVLKEFFIDSQLKKSEKLNQLDEPKAVPKTAEVNMSWKEYKEQMKQQKMNS